LNSGENVSSRYIRPSYEGETHHVDKPSEKSQFLWPAQEKLHIDEMQKLADLKRRLQNTLKN